MRSQEISEGGGGCWGAIRATDSHTNQAFLCDESIHLQHDTRFFPVCPQDLIVSSVQASAFWRWRED